MYDYFVSGFDDFFGSFKTKVTSFVFFGQGFWFLRDMMMINFKIFDFMCSTLTFLFGNFGLSLYRGKFTMFYFWRVHLFEQGYDLV